MSTHTDSLPTIKLHKPLNTAVAISTMIRYLLEACIDPATGFVAEPLFEVRIHAVKWIADNDALITPGTAMHIATCVQALSSGYLYSFESFAKREEWELIWATSSPNEVPAQEHKRSHQFAEDRFHAEVDDSIDVPYKCDSQVYASAEGRRLSNAFEIVSVNPDQEREDQLQRSEDRWMSEVAFRAAEAAREERGPEPYDSAEQEHHNMDENAMLDEDGTFDDEPDFTVMSEQDRADWVNDQRDLL